MDSKSKTHKIGTITFKSVSLWRILGAFRGRYITDGQPEELVVPYILTCAAYLESKLNDSIYQHAQEVYGIEITEGLMSMSLPKKLGVLVPLLTDGAFEINRNHWVYQRLAALIRTRNSLAHAKSEIEEWTGPESELIEVPGMFGESMKIPKDFLQPDITLGAARAFAPGEYHEALEKLDKWFFQRCPDRLSKVAMVNARDSDKGWKMQTTMLSKDLTVR